MENHVKAPALAGRVAVVTGAGGVLGSGFARCLARAGARVALVDLHREKAEAVAAELGQQAAQQQPSAAMSSISPRWRRRRKLLRSGWGPAISSSTPPGETTPRRRRRWNTPCPMRPPGTAQAFSTWTPPGSALYSI